MIHLKRLFGIILSTIMACLAASVLSAYAATARPTNKGALPMAVQKAIDEKKERLGASYTPRTRHFNETGSARFTNRLFLEESPYLLQHAHNPVNWHPWGEEAFALAKERNLPLLVSIGYATCHWCHVMEEESFEDLEIAEYLNTHFVAVKVDREERPDIDSVYMGAVQILTGAGGWPLNVFLTPDGKPFYGGTYFPARDGDRPPHTGFLTLLARITELYKTEKKKIDESAGRLTNALQQLEQKRTDGEVLPSLEWVTQAVSGYGSLYDASSGGTKGAPKFPSTLPVSLFLRQFKTSGNTAYKHMSEHSLMAMADGGIHDQVGGGFHRYSTDTNWLVPHFEKMLYDNALLASLYLEGFLATGNPRFEAVTRTTLDYLLKEMESHRGGFYSATDADSLTPSGHKEEGYFFTWSAQELEKALPHEAWRPVYDLYNLSDKPNFEGRIIPHRREDTEAVAKRHDLSTSDLNARVHEANEILYEARKARVAPLTDKKVIAAWNGLTLSALAKAGRHLSDPVYIESAEKTARFIVEELMEEGRLHRSKLEGIGPKGFLEDYAFVTQGLLDLFEATGDETWLKRGMELQAKATELFGAKDGGFYMTGSDVPALIARERPGHDGALPSGNGIAALNLFRLYALTTDTRYLSEATATVSAFVSNSKDPGPFSSFVGALDFHLSNPETLVLVLPNEPDGMPSQATRDALHAINTEYTPYAVTVVVHENETNTHTLGITKGKKAMEGKPTLYPCQDGTCSEPIVLTERPPAAR